MIRGRNALTEAEPERKVPFTNLDKVSFKLGYTKNISSILSIDLSLASSLLADRLSCSPLSDGIHGKSFFQKDAPPFVPSGCEESACGANKRARSRSLCVRRRSESSLSRKHGIDPLHIWSSQIERSNVRIGAFSISIQRAPFADLSKLLS